MGRGVDGAKRRGRKPDLRHCLAMSRLTVLDRITQARPTFLTEGINDLAPRRGPQKKYTAF